MHSEYIECIRKRSRGHCGCEQCRLILRSYRVCGDCVPIYYSMDISEVISVAIQRGDGEGDYFSGGLGAQASTY